MMNKWPKEEGVEVWEFVHPRAGLHNTRAGKLEAIRAAVDQQTIDLD